jgi:uncharacterized metal-binding protein YceD (DUF177 family)
MKRNNRAGGRSSPAVLAARDRVAKREAELGLSPGILGGPADVIGDSAASWVLRVDEIPDHGIEIKKEIPKQAVAALVKGSKDSQSHWEPTGPMHLDLALAPQIEGFSLKGQISLIVACDCVRCLENTEFAFDLDISLSLVEGEEAIDADRGYDLDPQNIASLLDGGASPDALFTDDEDFVVYQNEIIDLAALLREQILLDLPMNPRCGDPGATAQNTCAPIAEEYLSNKNSEVDPRWAPLAELSKKIGE